MATLQPGGLTVLGRISNLIFYKRHDLDQIIVRGKGGIPKERINNSPEFVNTRRVNKEFGGRSRATRWLLDALDPIRELADYNIAGHLNALIKPIQEMDSVNEWGRRSIEFTRHPRIFEGFSLNRRYPFDSVIRNSLRYSLNKQTLEASIDIPALVPGINFHVPGRYPMFSFAINPVVFPDLHYNETLSHYKPLNEWPGTMHAETITDWYPVLNGSPAMSLQMQVPSYTPPDEFFVFMLSIGIRFGTIGANGQVQQLKRAGCAKIITAV
jgi:hypothetical protein